MTKQGYVDGFLLVVKKDKVDAYKKMAKEGAKLWMKHGAISYFETMSDDMNPQWVKATFPKVVKAKPDEVIFFSFITYQSKAHRNTVNKKVMKDPYMNSVNKDKTMPFDMKRMSFGGFKTVVQG